MPMAPAAPAIQQEPPLFSADSAPVDLDSLRQQFEVDRSEVEREERVQQQLRAVLDGLEKRAQALERESARLRSEHPPPADVANLESDAVIASEANASAEARRASQAAALERRRCELSDEEGQAARFAEERVAAEADEAGWIEATSAASRRASDASDRSRNLVHEESLARGRAEAITIAERLRQQEAETMRLRQALADAWAARPPKDPFDEFSDAAEARAEASFETPGDAPLVQGEESQVDKDLAWLARAKEEAISEVQKVQHLEQQEAAAQRRFLAASEDHASLRSRHVDLESAGNTLREALASQSERYVGRVGGHTEAKHTTNADRAKLVDEVVGLEARHAELLPELPAIEELEARRAELGAERDALSGEAARLREMNTALSTLMLSAGDDDDVGLEAEASAAIGALRRVLQLQLRLLDREASHATEKERLAERIRTLERQAATGGPTEEPAAVAAIPRSKSDKGLFSVGKSAFRSGFGKIREAVA